jgi:hypothetical protein
MSSMLSFTSPYGGPASRTVLWFGFLGAPLAWSIQELVSYILMAHGCYPNVDPSFGANPPAAWMATTIVSILMLLMAVAALGVSIREVSRLISRSSYGEASAAAHRESAAPYLAFSGFLFGAIFTALIVYNGIALLGEHAC